MLIVIFLRVIKSLDILELTITKVKNAVGLVFEKSKNIHKQINRNATNHLAK
jgi:hypothetical protein